MSASQPAYFNLQEFTDAGLLLLGGRLYTYAYGTTAQKTAYTDAAGLVPHTYTLDGLGGQYIALNARGELPAPLYLAIGDYDIALKRSDGSTVWTRRAEPTVDGAPSGASMVGADDGAAGVLFTTVAGFIIALASSIGSSLMGFLQDGLGALLRSVQSRMRDTVSANDYMTAALIADTKLAVPTLDHTAAVQKAINYCITNNRDLEVPGLCRITAPLMVDRQVDGAAFDSYFTIRSSSGGGFYVDSAINLFSSNIVSATAPVSQLIRWERLRFVGSSGALAAYVLDGVKFLRCEFVGCNFSKIKFLLSAKYIQSIYLVSCNARRWVGTFFKAGPQCYDIKVIGGLYEAGGGDCFDWTSPIGCNSSATIEGMAGTAIKYVRAQGLCISGGYFEGNGLDIDGSDASGSVSYGVALLGNYFSHANPTQYSVRWGRALGAISSGNWHTASMHDFTESIIDIEINDVAQNSLSNRNDENNMRRGNLALTANTTGARNTAYGFNALSANTTGTDNTAFGYQTLKVAVAIKNTAFGKGVLTANTTGMGNTAMGMGALAANVSGSSNVAIGWDALSSNALDGNTGVGVGALSTIGPYTLCTGLGYNAQVTASSQVQLGDSSTTTYVFGTVQNRSDVRDKADVRNTVLGLDFIKLLRPVDAKWDMRVDYANGTPNGTKKRSRYHHFLIAQEVKAVADSLGVDFGGYQDHKVGGGEDVLSLGYDEFIPPVIRAIQEINAKFEAYKAAHP